MGTLNDMILQCYPKAADCVNGHIGQTVWGWYWEQDDDRGYLMKVPRCDHCSMPNGADDYATYDEQQAYYRGEQPKPVEEVAKT
jgi:hypothetical protein